MMLTLDLANPSALPAAHWFQAAPVVRPAAQWRVYTQALLGAYIDFIRVESVDEANNMHVLVAATPAADRPHSFVVGLEALTDRIRSGATYEASAELFADADRALAAAATQKQTVRQWAKGLAESVFIR